MAAGPPPSPRERPVVARLAASVARAMALLGGAVLIALVSVTCLSIAGRWLGGLGHGPVGAALGPLGEPLRALGPIRGDFELVEAGVAFAIMAFLPWCQLTRAHASVDVLAQALGPRAEGALALLWETVFTLVLWVFAWRLWAGTADKLRTGETTFMLQMPVWWGYAAVCAASAVAALVALVAVWERAAALRPPRSELVGAGDPDAVHPPAGGG